MLEFFRVHERPEGVYYNHCVSPSVRLLLHVAVSENAHNS